MYLTSFHTKNLLKESHFLPKRFIFDLPETDHEGKVESAHGDSKDATDAASNLMKHSLRGINKMDPYIQAWSKAEKDPQKIDQIRPSEFKAGEVVASRASGLHFREEKTGSVEKPKLAENIKLKITDPLERVLVSGVIFTKVQMMDGSGKTGFVAEGEQKNGQYKSYLAKPIEKRYTEKKVTRNKKNPANGVATKAENPGNGLPNGWINDEVTGETRPMTPDEMAWQKKELESLASIQQPEKPAEKQERVSDVPKNMNEFLTAHPEFQKFYTEFRRSFKDTVLNLFTTIPQDMPVRKSVATFYSGLSNMDQTMFSLFMTVGLHENAALRTRLLQHPVKFTLSLADLPPGVAGRTNIARKPVPLEINKQYGSKPGENANEFKTTIIHELSHIFLEDLGGYHRNPQLNEGVTEMLAQHVNPSHVHEDHLEAYKEGTALANVLIKIDKAALMDWYTGGSDQEFKNNFTKKLAPMVGETRAQEVMTSIMSLQGKTQRARENAVKKIADFVRGKYPDLYAGKVANIEKATTEFLSNQIALDKWETVVAQNTPEALQLKTSPELIDALDGSQKMIKEQENQNEKTMGSIASEIAAASGRRANA